MSEPTEKLKCPRKIVGPGLNTSKHDEWVLNRWTGKGCTWPQGFLKPRSCSCCGGVHPDDAVALLGKGWEIEPTTKPYKWYLVPPGSALYHKRLLKAIAKHSDMPSSECLKLSPPVKLYGQHCNKLQLKELNALYDRQRQSSVEVN